MPTLVALAGVELDVEVDGRSVAEPIRQSREPDPKPVFAEIATWRSIQGLSDDPAERAAHVMVRDGPWKYVWNRLDEDELYDLVRDPLEMRNLRDAYPERIETERNLVRTMLVETGPGPYAWCMA